jgi:uncharacterized protein (DUF1778 family)
MPAHKVADAVRRDRMVNIRISEEERQWIAAAAEQRGMTLTALIRSAALADRLATSAG